MDRKRSLGGHNKQPRFSIHDAFEEENDEAIKVYGSTVISNAARSSSSVNINIRSSNEMSTLSPGDR